MALEKAIPSNQLIFKNMQPIDYDPQLTAGATVRDEYPEICWGSEFFCVGNVRGNCPGGISWTGISGRVHREMIDMQLSKGSSGRNVRGGLLEKISGDGYPGEANTQTHARTQTAFDQLYLSLIHI